MLNPPSLGAKLFALFLNGAQLGYRGVLFAWANDIMRADDAKRAIVISMMNAMSKLIVSFSIILRCLYLLTTLRTAIAFYIWWSLVFYNTAQSPDWYIGNIAMICTGVAMMASLFSVVMFERRDTKKLWMIEGLSIQRGTSRTSADTATAIQKEMVKTTAEV